MPSSSPDSARLIENLLHTYAELIDAGDLDGVADLFAHGRILGQEGGGPETVFEGREGVRKLYGFSTRIYEDTGTPRTKHVTTNAIIDVDEEAGTGTCRSYFTVLQATDALARRRELRHELSRPGAAGDLHFGDARRRVIGNNHVDDLRRLRHRVAAQRPHAARGESVGRLFFERRRGQNHRAAARVLAI